MEPECFAGADLDGAPVESVRDVGANAAAFVGGQDLVVSTGDDLPLGSAGFHSTFVAAPISRGRVPSSETPDPFGS